MKIAIIGAGAIGGYIGGRLARAGIEVSLLARGAHLAAIQTRGLTLEFSGEGGTERYTVHPRASDDPAALGPQDALIITVKAPALPELAPRLKPLLGPDTAWVTAMNGIPYWYFFGHPGPLANTRLKGPDPSGSIWHDLPPERAIGGVLWLPASVPEPGLVKRGNGNRLSLGEPDGSTSARLTAIAAALQQAGIEAPLKSDIRQEIWHKLWGNLSFSPLAVLTLSTHGALVNDPGTRAVARAMMLEAQAVGEALGISFPGDADERIKHSATIGAHKPSMLQDLEAGRPMEIESITGVISELGRLTGHATPTIDLVLALARRRAANLTPRS